MDNRPGIIEEATDTIFEYALVGIFFVLVAITVDNYEKSVEGQEKDFLEHVVGWLSYVINLIFKIIGEILS